MGSNLIVSPNVITGSELPPTTTQASINETEADSKVNEIIPLVVTTPAKLKVTVTTTAETPERTLSKFTGCCDTPKTSETTLDEIKTIFEFPTIFSKIFGTARIHNTSSTTATPTSRLVTTTSRKSTSKASTTPSTVHSTSPAFLLTTNKIESSSTTDTKRFISKFTKCCDKPKTWETTDILEPITFRKLTTARKPTRTSHLITTLSTKPVMTLSIVPTLGSTTAAFPTTSKNTTTPKPTDSKTTTTIKKTTPKPTDRKTTPPTSITPKLIPESTPCCDRPQTWQTTDTDTPRELTNPTIHTTRLITILTTKPSTSSSITTAGIISSISTTIKKPSTTQSTSTSFRSSTDTYTTIRSTFNQAQNHSTCCDRPQKWETTKIPEPITMEERLLFIPTSTKVPSRVTTTSTKVTINNTVSEPLPSITSKENKTKNNTVSILLPNGTTEVITTNTKKGTSPSPKIITSLKNTTGGSSTASLIISTIRRGTQSTKDIRTITYPKEKLIKTQSTLSPGKTYSIYELSSNERAPAIQQHTTQHTHTPTGFSWWYPTLCNSTWCQRPVTWLTTKGRKRL